MDESRDAQTVLWFVILNGVAARDDGSGYFWIDDTDYNLVMHPILDQ